MENLNPAPVIDQKIIKFREFLSTQFNPLKDNNSEFEIWQSFYLCLLDQFKQEFIADLDFEFLADFLWQRYTFFKEQVYNPEFKVNIIEGIDFISSSSSPHATDIPQISKQLGLCEITIDDRPFIIDSLFNILTEGEIKISHFIHPIFNAILNDDKLSHLSLASTSQQNRISYVLILTSAPITTVAEDLHQKIIKCLNEVKIVTKSYEKIYDFCEQYTIKKNKESSDSIIESEQREIFNWYLRGNLVLLGYGTVLKSEIDALDFNLEKVENKTAWLELSNSEYGEDVKSEIVDSIKYFNKSSLQNSLIELNHKSFTHKRENVILAFHKIKEENQKTVLVIIACIFTNSSYNENISNIPIVRLKLNGICEKMNLLEGSHDYKNALEFYGKFPRNELFRLNRDELFYMYNKARELWDIDQFVVDYYVPPDLDYIRIMCILPFDKISTSASEILVKELQKAIGKPFKYYYNFVYKSLSHNHLVWFIDNTVIKNLDFDKLTQKLRRRLRTWEESLKGIISRMHAVNQDQTLLNLANIDFPEDYKSLVSPEEAAFDIDKIKDLLTTKDDVVDAIIDESNRLKIKIYALVEYSLRNIFLKFDTLSLETLDVERIKLRFMDNNVHIQNYYSKYELKSESEFENLKQRFVEFFKKSLHEKLENDQIFGLLFKTQLSFRKILILKTYRNYLCLINPNFNQANLNRLLLDHPNFSINLVKYFEKKFEPKNDIWQFDNEDHLKDEIKTLKKNIVESKSLFDDTAMKTFLSIAIATLRTNYYSEGFDSIAIKINCLASDYVPSPKPMFEIFVAGEFFEGIHLRGSKISRGGLRYSDRIEDYRTEILGLMLTQALKNVVIVPSGAKGGFIIKRRWNSRDEELESVPKYYKHYINNLLSLTDNIKAGKIVNVKDVVRYDQDDAYLVVAADKGTANYSDLANSISIKKDFWLGDAFASGGSNGYNHKELGITARGAFECLKIHFQELGHDFDNNTFTVIGIGDMSGDVFGNGTLLSENIKLVAAFNHQHIFIDPDPDPKISFTERQRMFDLPRSTWNDYNKELISEGGGVFSRTSKSVKLSPQMKLLLGTNSDELSGVALIKLILTCQVDVLFNGGIGVYIKSNLESKSDIGDKVNDSVRVNAEKVKARVILEGGNLAITPLGRIEFSLNDGLINSDAIDNSAGVDMSDHEVNIKILLNTLLEQGLLKDKEEISQILNKLSSEVTQLCLRDNQEQAYRISLDSRRSKYEGNYYAAEIEHLEFKKELSRGDNFLPSNQWFLENFKKEAPIPRPILAILMSHVKNYVFDQIYDSSIHEDKELLKFFIRYFPKSLTDEVDLAKIPHPLKKEITCSVLSNFFVNYNGLAFLPVLHNITSHKSISIIFAFLIVISIFHTKDLRIKILKNCPPNKFDEACNLILELENITRERTVWFLSNFNLSELSFDNLKHFRTCFSDFLNQPDEIKYNGKKFKETEERLQNLNYSPTIVKDYLNNFCLDNPLESTMLRSLSKLDWQDIRVLINTVNENFGFSAIEQELFLIAGKDEWQKIYIGELIFKTNKIKGRYYNIIHKYIDKYGKDIGMSKFLEERKKPLENYKQQNLKFFSNRKSHLVAISVLLEKLDKAMKPELL